MMSNKLLLLLAVFVFTLTACELEDPVQPIGVQAARGLGDCDPDIRSFDLTHTPLGQSSYLVTLETGPFQIGNCMCKLLNYKLYVSPNSSSQWELALSSNQLLNFEPSSTESGDILTISDLEPIFENIGNPGNGKLHAAILNSANAELNHAGGLCIVENFDGSEPHNGTMMYAIGSTANGPIIRLKPGQLPDSYIVEVYIPVGITSPI
jgi:hypothetical protein